MISRSSLLVVIALIVTIIDVSSSSSIANGSYRAAVVEHVTYSGHAGDSAATLKNKNLDIYQSHVEAAAKQKVQLIVFPEYGLVPVSLSNRSAVAQYAEDVPDVGVNPCSQPALYANRSSVYRGSCMARNNSMIVVIDQFDIKKCSPSDTKCPKDGYYHYNAAVVYSESGTIIAKYYKSHAWATNEDAPSVPDRVTWTASFGVTFGMFICFDIAFDDPAVVLAKQGIKHFIYPVAQGSIGRSVLIQPWSLLHQTTVLAANAGYDCSGIVVNGKLLPVTTIQLSPTERSLVAAVPF